MRAGGVNSNGGGVGNKGKVLMATQVSMTKVPSRLQVSGFDDEHGQEVLMVRAGGVHSDSGGVGNKGEVSTARCHSANRDQTMGHTPATQSGHASPQANCTASCPSEARACCSGPFDLITV